MQILGAQLVCGEDPIVGQVVARSLDLGEGLRVREQLKGVLEGFEVAWAEDDRGRSAVASQDNPLVLTFHTVDDLGQVGLDLG
jgi:hypothetical protein